MSDFPPRSRSDFGLPEGSMDTAPLFAAVKQRLRLLAGAQGQNTTTQKIVIDVQREIPRLDKAVDAENIVQFKGFLESLNERMANLGVELGQEVGMNPDTEARARDLIKALRALQASL